MLTTRINYNLSRSKCLISHLFQRPLIQAMFPSTFMLQIFLYTTNIRLWAMMFLKKHTDSGRSKCSSEIHTQPPQILLPYNMPFQGHCLFWCWTSDNFDHLELQPLFFPPEFLSCAMWLSSLTREAMGSNKRIQPGSLPWMTRVLKEPMLSTDWEL